LAYGREQKTNSVSALASAEEIKYKMKVKSALRVLDIFELLADQDQGLNVSEISTKLGFPLSSTHALLKTLISRGYLVLELTNRKYRLGARLFEVGNQYIEDLSVVDIARAPMRHMRELCDETISLGIFDGVNGIILIRKNESSRALRIGNPLGTRLPVHASAMGKAILATWSWPEVENLVEGRALDNPVETSSLLKDLEGVKKTQIAYDMEESTEGVCAIATALNTGSNRSMTSLAIVVPSVRARGESWKRLPDLLLAGAGVIGDIYQGKEIDLASTFAMELDNTWSGGLS
jgi:DNA-binding IclR family transcriptional regulator